MYVKNKHNPQFPNILVCFTGSVATLKIPELVNNLKQFANIRLIGSGETAYHFFWKSKSYNLFEWTTFVNNGGLECLIFDEDEWSSWNCLGDSVLHIEVRKWAHVLLVAPASANTICKAASGIADSLLLSVLRAWDFQNPCIMCPAMNTMMWTHPSTNMGLSTLRSWGWIVVDPIVKNLACNDTGKGALAPVDTIVNEVKALIRSKLDKGAIRSSSEFPLTSLKLRRGSNGAFSATSFMVVSNIAFWLIAQCTS